ncbi:MAG: metallophosphoesterase [Myxococcales bacterium]|nr:metallophosphoesterase [Myxococcales bacterium]
MSLARRFALARERARSRAHRITVRRHHVPWPGLSPLRLVHLTDLHIGRATPDAVLQTALAQTSLLRPDLVVLTGDYLNHSLKHIGELERFLRALPRPCVASLGNHDHYSGVEVITGTIERHGIPVLRNNSQRVSLADGRVLEVVGVDDAFTGRHDVERAFDGVEDAASALVLSHSPAAADEIAARGGRLILSGHTHAGQLNTPRIERAVKRLTRQRYIAGWYDLAHGARLYVNAGLGASAISLRLGAAATPEVALLELV